MIPDLTNEGLLPPGIHWSTWQEIVDYFGKTQHRMMLLQGLKDALTQFRDAGCRVIYVNGSFVTNKQIPNDYDVLWEFDHVDPDQVDPVLLDIFKYRDMQKAIYGGEFFAIRALASSTEVNPMITFFQTTSDGIQKGILALDLRGFL